MKQNSRKRNFNRDSEEGRNRLTLGLLTHGARDPNNCSIWSGVADVARENGANLVCFPGKSLHSRYEFEAQANVIYDLVDTKSIQALVIWLAGLTLWVDQEEIQAFCESFRPLPVVTVGLLLEGFPGVVVDNYHGMRAVVSHIIDAHRRTRIAFIRGPELHQEAEERYRAYLDVLAEYGITLDPELVVLGNFKESGGVLAARELLEQRRVEFDALVAASDNMAIGAMKVLQEHGVRIPAEVAVAGLNDEVPSKFVSPPLTTGPLHFYEQARQATETVFALLRGEAVTEHLVLPTNLLVRQSCGCPDPAIVRASAPLPLDTAPSTTAGASRLERTLAQALQKGGNLEDETEAKYVRRLVKVFLAEIDGKMYAEFLPLLSDGLRRSVLAGDSYLRWTDLISTLRRSLLAHLLGQPEFFRAENLLHQARVLVGETAQRGRVMETLQVEQKLHNLAQISQKMSISANLGELVEVLARTLPLINITRCYLSLYEDAEKPAEFARLVAAFDERGMIDLEPEGRRFPAPLLIPEGFLPDGKAYSMVVEPLYFRSDQLGFILFEADPADDEIYETLSEQISSAIRRTILTERNIRLYNEAVEARQAAEAANQLKSRFLSMVSHELRTPLSLIVGTIEMMLQEEKVNCVPPLPTIYRRDMDRIHAGAQHLFRLIGDVLDLACSQAGELRLTCEPVNLSKLLHEIALLGESMAREKGLLWRVEISDMLPVVWADRTRLRQVTLNLLSNAIKFTEHGEVALRAYVDDFMALVSVRDTGMGIPLVEQETIFDEFRRSGRSLERGYGGMGLGLAVSRRLIELHGGKIWVRSSGEEEAGSTFYYSLPALEWPLNPKDQETHTSRTVLLLAESETGTEKLYDHLARRGFEVDVLAVGANPDWLAMVMASPPGAVVLDFQPAAEQGWELMRLLKQNSLTREIPVIFYTLSDERQQGSVLEMDYLTKPLSSAELAQALDQLGLRASQPVKTILVVDDEPSILEMHTRMLECELPDCRVIQARSGREALELIQKHRPNLMLLDLMMPDVDGFEVLQTMRDRYPGLNLPVIVLTAQVLTGHDMERLHQGVSAVLSKGLFSLSEVMAQVETALARSKRLGSEAQRIVRLAIAFINEHYAEPLSRASLAQHLSVSENYLTRCFQQEMSVSVITYLNRFRILRAKALLESGEASISEIAEQVGFSDSNYFGRVFRNEVGVSPGAYLHGKRSPGK